MYFYKFFLLVIFVFQLGCQSLSINIPTPMVEPPEIAGGGKFSGSLAALPSRDFEVTGNAGARPPDLDDREIHRNADYEAHGEYGVTDFMAVGLGWNPLSGFGHAKLKLVLSGSTLSSSKAGPQLAVWGRYGMGYESEEGDQSVTFGSGRYPWEAWVRTVFSGIGASAGYKFTDKFGLFVGAARDWHDFDVEVNHDEGGGGSSPAARYETSYKGHLNAAALGFRINYKNTAVTLQASYTESFIDGVRDRYDLNYMLMGEVATK